MHDNLRPELISCLTNHPPGTILVDINYWIGRAKMVITRHRVISSVGDDQEQYYQQKYILNTNGHEIVVNPPTSWVEYCASNGMCDDHLDALTCL